MLHTTSAQRQGLRSRRTHECWPGTIHYVPPGAYHVFAVIQPSRQQVESDGTNDVGETAAITVSE